jgi:hypothetical protein
MKPHEYRIGEVDATDESFPRRPTCNCGREGQQCNFHLFPSTAYDHLRRSNTSIAPAIGWTQIIRALFCGIHDEACILNRLRGQEDTLVRYISTFMDTEYLKNVTLTFTSKTSWKGLGWRYYSL